MSKKSLLLSILALVLYIGFIVGMVFLFKVQFILGLVGVLLLLIPLKVQRKAIEETSGKLDEIFAKYVIAILLGIAILFVILYFTMWA